MTNTDKLKAAEELKEIAKLIFEASERMSEAADIIDLSATEILSTDKSGEISKNYRRASKGLEKNAQKAQAWAKALLKEAEA